MIKEIARRAGVSVTTVTNVMHGRKDKVSEATFEKIDHMIRENDYQLNIRASLLAGSKNQLTAVLDFRSINEEFNGGEWYCQLRGLVEAIYRDGHYALVHFPQNLEEGICYVKTWRAGEIITLGIDEKQEQLIGEACNCTVLKVENINRN